MSDRTGINEQVRLRRNTDEELNGNAAYAAGVEDAHATADLMP